MFFTDFAFLVWPISWHKVGGVYCRYHSWPPGELTDVLGSFHWDLSRYADALQNNSSSVFVFFQACSCFCVRQLVAGGAVAAAEAAGRLLGVSAARHAAEAVYSPPWFFHWLRRFSRPVFWKKTTKSEHVSRCYLNISTHLRVCLKRSRAWRCWVWGPLLPLSGCWHCRRLMLRPAVPLESTLLFQNGSTFVLKIGFVYVLWLQ